MKNLLKNLTYISVIFVWMCVGSKLELHVFVDKHMWVLVVAIAVMVLYVLVDKED